MDKVSEVFPFVAPSIAAFGVISAVVIASSQCGHKRVMVQVMAFATLLAIGVSFLLKHAGEWETVWAAFKAMPDEIKFTVTIFVAIVTYFGAALYASGPPCGDEDKHCGLKAPASWDPVVDFHVPIRLPDNNVDAFKQVFEQITNEIVGDMPTVYEMPEEAVKWVDRMIRYTAYGGKMNRGLAVMDVQEIFAKAEGRTLSTKERMQAAALGWGIEFLQAFFLVADDVMDSSVTRRGEPCWYRLEDVKLIAINDSFVLESCVYKIIRRYFAKERVYPQLVDLFIEVTRQTEYGQLLDLTSQPQNGTIDLTRFTLQRYKSIVRYKTAFYSFYIPVALGMIISGVTDVAHYHVAREILILMGEYFQVADDYLDCYGDPAFIGKVGTDIQDNKCSWLVVQALDRVTPQQRKILEENYGRHDDKCVATVKALYRELNIEKVFRDYEEEFNRQFHEMMKEVSGMPKEVFETFYRKIYKRDK